MVIDKIRIEKEAKEILDKFAKALEKVEKESDKEIFIEREEFERHEKNINLSNKPDNNFKKRILDNSPNHDEDFIIAEKGSWK